ncbi:MAG: mechanosensitive ion channel family protein [Gemmatimonadales bacterium]
MQAPPPPVPARPDTLVGSFLEQVEGFLRMPPGMLARVVLTIGLIWLAAWVADRLLKLIVRRILRVVVAHDDDTMTAAEKRSHTIAQLVRSVGRVVVIVLALLLTLDIFLDIRTLLAGVGILGLAVSFGAQSLVKDVISGFFILVENQFVVGDQIEAAGKTGTVERMTLRAFMLRDLDGTLHHIPNGNVVMVSNKSRGWSRAIVEIGVSYSADLDRTLELFREEARSFYDDPAWHARFEGAPEVSGVEQLGDTRVVIRTLFRTVAGAHNEAAREFRRRIKNRLEQDAKDRVRGEAARRGAG